MPNLGKIVAGHNARVTSPPAINLEERNCNCQGKNAICVMERSRFKDSGVVYQAEVTPQNKPKRKYVGITAPSWKLRYGNHKASFKHSAKRKNTKLSGYIWSLKDEGIKPEVKWRILARCQPSKASSNSCRLCLRKKFIVMHKPGRRPRSTAGTSSSLAASISIHCCCELSPFLFLVWKPLTQYFLN